MGLFNWGKKQTSPGSSHAASASPAPVAPTAAAEVKDPFDLLMESARGGDAGAMSRLWETIYRSPSWHFVRRGGPEPFSMKFNPFCGVVDGQPSVFAFTDSARASRFGVRQKLGESGGFEVMEIARDAAITSVLRLAPGGVTRIIFNDQPPSGLFAPLSNLVFMYSHILGVPLAEAATKFELDPAGVLHDRVSQTGQDAHIRELVAWAVARPSWWMLASESGVPLVWKTAEGESTAAVFTSQERMENAGRKMKLAEEYAPVPSRQLSVDEAIDCVEEMVAQQGLQTVALNLRLPLRADKLRALREAVRG